MPSTRQGPPAGTATPPPSALLLGIIEGSFLAQILCTAAELGIADVLADGPLSLEELATRVGAQPDHLRRLLRPLLAEGIFSCSDNNYALNSLAEPLRGDAPDSVRALARFVGDPKAIALWGLLPTVVRTGESAAELLYGMPFFDYIQKNRAFGEVFDTAMTEFSVAALEPTLAAYDFSGFGTIVDIGGGHGRLLTEILTRTPGTRGVLFDLPDVLAPVPDLLAERGLADRCAVVTGSFFDEAPASGDAYILKHIIHDWTDDKAARILRTVRAAMSDSARLLLIEMVLAEEPERGFGTLLDLEMLLTAGGRERTEREYRELLAANGFELVRRVRTAGVEEILEARPI